MHKELENIKDHAEKEGKALRGSISFLQLAEKQEGGGVRGLGPIRVRVLDIENEERKPYRSEEEMNHLVLYVDHGGEKKQYAKPVLKWKDSDGNVIPKGDRDEVHYLVADLIDIGVDVGDELILEYKKQEGSFRGFIDVRRPEDERLDVPPVDDDDIPVVKEDELDIGENRGEI